MPVTKKKAAKKATISEGQLTELVRGKHSKDIAIPGCKTGDRAAAGLVALQEHLANLKGSK